MKLILFVFLIFSLGSCKKIIGEDDISQNPQAVVSDSFYFKAQFNNTIYINWIVPSRNNELSYQFHSSASFGYDNLSGGQCIENYCYYLSAYTQISRNVPAVKPQINIGFNMATQQTGRDEFLSWFNPGFKNYGQARASTLADIYNPAKNGVIVYYMDENGKSWFSGAGSQQGSVFESVSVKDLPGINNPHLNKIWKARFSCRLYDEVGNWINVTNGEIYNRIMLP